MKSVFLDTAALIALTNTDDSLHAEAAEVDAQLNAANRPLVTSDFVLIEYLNALSAKRFRRAALRMLEHLTTSPGIRIEPATRKLFLHAVELYRERTDKDWSLVDCSSILICRDRRIDTIFTSDHHFTQAGFEILL